MSNTAIKPTINIENVFRKYCNSAGLEYTNIKDLCPYNTSTLFCPAGMQQYTTEFVDQTVANKTVANIQPCLRLNDYDELGDGSHFLYFKMLGLFSFRDWSLQTAIDFWMNFVVGTLGLTVDHVTIHPDKMDDWKALYSDYPVKIVADPECTWSDGNSVAYCTEFYIGDIEIGNIVNPGGDCIDAGFGYERLSNLVNNVVASDKNDILLEAVTMILRSGYLPGPKKQGSILRKLIRDIDSVPENYVYYDTITLEKERLQKCRDRYYRLIKAKKRQGKSSEWWLETFGIDVSLV